MIGSHFRSASSSLQFHLIGEKNPERHSRIRGVFSGSPFILHCVLGKSPSFPTHPPQKGGQAGKSLWGPAGPSFQYLSKETYLQIFRKHITSLNISVPYIHCSLHLQSALTDENALQFNCSVHQLWMIQRPKGGGGGVRNRSNSYPGSLILYSEFGTVSDPIRKKITYMSKDKDDLQVKKFYLLFKKFETSSS